MVSRVRVRDFAAQPGQLAAHDLLDPPPEVERIDPLLAAVDAAFQAASPRESRLADVTDALASTLTGHLAHEERDGLPLIGVALTAAEWRGVGFKIARKNGLDPPRSPDPPMNSVPGDPARPG